MLTGLCRGWRMRVPSRILSPNIDIPVVHSFDWSKRGNAHSTDHILAE